MCRSTKKIAGIAVKTAFMVLLHINLYCINNIFKLMLNVCVNMWFSKFYIKKRHAT